MTTCGSNNAEKPTLCVESQFGSQGNESMDDYKCETCNGHGRAEKWQTIQVVSLSLTIDVHIVGTHFAIIIIFS